MMDRMVVVLWREYEQANQRARDEYEIMSATVDLRYLGRRWVKQNWDMIPRDPRYSDGGSPFAYNWPYLNRHDRHDKDSTGVR